MELHLFSVALILHQGGGEPGVHLRGIPFERGLQSMRRTCKLLPHRAESGIEPLTILCICILRKFQVISSIKYNSLTITQTTTNTQTCEPDYLHILRSHPDSCLLTSAPITDSCFNPLRGLIFLSPNHSLSNQLNIE